LFATPEDNHPPPVVCRANELAASARTEVAGGLQQLRQDAELLKHHMNSLRHASSPKFGKVDVALATARIKIEQCETFDEAVKWLDKSEVRALLGDAAFLQRTLELRC
jgi:membrane glycosyltransferase